MKFELINAWHSFLKLLRFLFWYGAAVALLFYLAPVAGRFVQGQYEALNGSVRFLSILGFFAVVAVWQILGQWERFRDFRNRR